MTRWGLVCLLLVGCDDGGAEPADAALADAGLQDSRIEDAQGDRAALPEDAGVEVDAEVDAAVAEDPDCDPLVPEVCAMPWPSSKFLRPDPDTPTGLRIAFGPTTLPANRSGAHVDPESYNRLDGYAVGSYAAALIPNLDPDQLVGEYDLEESLAEDARVLLYEAREDGLHQIPCFAELDARTGDPLQRSLIVRPAVLLKEATRYVVALRALEDLEGARVEPSPAFAGFLSGEGGERQPAFDQIFAELDALGVDRGELTLAWDFTTASCEAIHGRMLHMRDEAFELEPPQITAEVRQVEDPNIALEIEGTIRVPHYMEPWGPYLTETGWRMHLEEGQPAQNGWREAPFIAFVPHSALEGEPTGLMNFGHGLNGTYGQLNATYNKEIAQQQRLVVFAWNMVGMSNEDVQRILVILTDLSWYPWLSDRLHQGMLDGLLLARAMKAGLGAFLEGRVEVDPTRVYYSGHSQGGIYGAPYLALSPDTRRGLLGVPGQNYSTLLERSVDFDPFLLGIQGSYARRADQIVGIAMVQMLWDSLDPVSYYRHLSVDPLPGSEASEAILAPAKGDYQVSPMSIEIVARSEVGVALMEHYDDELEVPLVEAAAYPVQGSAIVNWHFGGAWPPAGNRTPPGNDAGDPHGKPRRHPAHMRQMGHFFETGEVIDVCEGGTCPP